MIIFIFEIDSNIAKISSPFLIFLERDENNKKLRYQL